MSARAAAWPVPATSGNLAPTGSIESDLATRSDIVIARTTDMAIARIITAAATVVPAGPACGHPTGGAGSGCAATVARPTDIAAIIIARSMDIDTAIIARPTGIGRAVTERQR